MQLKDTRATVTRNTAKASDINRQLCFAALEIIWLFKTGTTIPATLQFPVILVISALIFDLLQYIAITVMVGWFHRIKEKELSFNEEEHFTISDRIYWPSRFCFWMKIVLNGLAYGLLGWYLAGQLF